MKYLGVQVRQVGHHEHEQRLDDPHTAGKPGTSPEHAGLTAGHRGSITRKLLMNLGHNPSRPGQMLVTGVQ